jgi:hypothetical protein
MQDEATGTGVPETTQATTKKKKKIKELSASERREYDAEKQREKRERDHTAAECEAEALTAPACSKAEAIAILEERFQDAEPVDHLVNTVYDLAIVACDKLKLCSNRHYFVTACRRLSKHWSRRLSYAQRWSVKIA